MRVAEPQFEPDAMPVEGAPVAGVQVRRSWQKHLLTFLMVFGPGLIVMEADNDAGAVSTYMQAGGQYGLHLLVDSDRAAAHLLLRAGDGSPVGDCDRQGPRGHDLRALRQVVGTLLALRFALGQLPDAYHRVCRDLSCAQRHGRQPLDLGPRLGSRPDADGRHRQLSALGTYRHRALPAWT